MNTNQFFIAIVLTTSLLSWHKDKPVNRENLIDVKEAKTSTKTVQEPSKQNLVANPGFEKMDLSTNLPEGWLNITPRAELAPSFEIDKSVSHSGKFSASISAKGSPGTFGYFVTSIKGIQSESQAREFRMSKESVKDTIFLSNKSYRVTCFFKTKDIESIAKSVWIRINWLDKSGKFIFTEFISKYLKEGDWYRVDQVITAPRASTGFNLELALQWTSTGIVWWDDVSVVETTSPLQRWIKVATSNTYPSSPSTPEKNRSFYADKIIEAGKLGVDILCLGEGITVVSTNKKYVDVAEPIPGPTSQILGEAARKSKLYVVAGIYEREGSLVYNTALLIDRNGNITGKYRKTHIPLTEAYGGITPGTAYPVFQTDFGTVGIEVCYDNFFPEVTRSLALQGAEIILLPIWGDLREQGSTWDVVLRSRAIDNAVYFVASEYGPQNSLIIHPTGRILENDDNVKGLITARIQLNQRTFEPWLSYYYGEWKNLFIKERRGETYNGLR